MPIEIIKKEATKNVSELSSMIEELDVITCDGAPQGIFGSGRNKQEEEEFLVEIGKTAKQRGIPLPILMLKVIDFKKKNLVIDETIEVNGRVYYIDYKERALYNEEGEEVKKIAIQAFLGKEAIKELLIENL